MRGMQISALAAVALMVGTRSACEPYHPDDISLGKNRFGLTPRADTVEYIGTEKSMSKRAKRRLRGKGGI